MDTFDLRSCGSLFYNFFLIEVLQRMVRILTGRVGSRGDLSRAMSGTKTATKKREANWT